MWWLVPGTFWMLDMTPPGFIIQGVAFPAMYGVGSMLVPAERGRRVALPAMLVLVAALRWNWPFGGVPLASLAMTQSDAPLLITARLFTALTVVALVGVVGVGLSATAERNWRAAGIAAGIVVASMGLAMVAPTGSVTGTRDIAIVQGGGPQNTRAINSDADKVFARHVNATSRIEGPVDFVLWPENAITTNGPFSESEEYETIAALAAEHQAPFIVGIFERIRSDPGTASAGYNLNAQATITADGTILSRYDKLRRVPFGEFVPLRWLIEPFAPAALPARDTRAGTEAAVIDTGADATAAVSISWEIFHDDRAHDGVRNGGEILLNPTNGSSYWLTILQTQQVASSRLRAVETGRYVLQAAPTGFSAIVEPDGTVIGRSGVSETKVIQGTVELRTGHTWSVAYGWWPPVIAAAVVLAAAIAHSRRPSRSSSLQ